MKIITAIKTTKAARMIPIIPLARRLITACSLITALSILPIQVTSAAATGSVNSVNADNWRFQVLLEDKPIGFHSFDVTTHNDQVQVITRADFTVKILGFTVYTYQHRDTERWQGACLTRMQASTNDNGDRLLVNGTLSNDHFRVKTHAANSTTLPACVKSFAYWHLPHLKAPQLLNSQTGELVSANLKKIGNEEIIAGGSKVAATRYRLSAKDFQIDLWYSAQNRWLGLESLTDGKRIRYVLQ